MHIITSDQLEQKIQAEAREYMVERRVSQEFEAEQQDLEKTINQIVTGPGRAARSAGAGRAARAASTSPLADIVRFTYSVR